MWRTPDKSISRCLLTTQLYILPNQEFLTLFTKKFEGSYSNLSKGPLSDHDVDETEMLCLSGISHFTTNSTQEYLLKVRNLRVLQMS